MINFETNATSNDLVLEKRNIKLTTGTSALAQLCENRLMMFKNDYFLDKSQGIPYISSVFVKSTDRSLVDSYYKSVLLSTPGINSIISFSGVYIGLTRTYNISFKLSANVGDDIVGNVSVGVL